MNVASVLLLPIQTNAYVSPLPNSAVVKLSSDAVLRQWSPVIEVRKPVKNDALGQHGYSNGTALSDCDAGVTEGRRQSNKWPAVSAEAIRPIISFSTCDQVAQSV